MGGFLLLWQTLILSWVRFSGNAFKRKLGSGVSLKLRLGENVKELSTGSRSLLNFIFSVELNNSFPLLNNHFCIILQHSK